MFSRFVHLPSRRRSSERGSAVVLVPQGRSSIYLFIPVLILSLAIIHAPSFLHISDAPVKVDAVVLFLGGEKGAREKEAEQLLRKGFADYLIIPATGQIKKRGPDGKLEAFDFKNSMGFSPQYTNLPINQVNRFIENTHIEVLGAKHFMENLGLRSALFVSSPYQMRRIKIITRKFFNDSQAVGYLPTRYETAGKGLWLFNSDERNFVLTEYTKIAWFFLYSSFL